MSKFKVGDYFVIHCNAYSYIGKVTRIGKKMHNNSDMSHDAIFYKTLWTANIYKNEGENYMCVGSTNYDIAVIINEEEIDETIIGLQL